MDGIKWMAPLGRLKIQIKEEEHVSTCETDICIYISL